MKKTKLLQLLLFCLALLCAVSCSKKNDGTSNGNTDRVVISAEQSGIRSHGRLTEAELPQNAEILDWYEEAKDREVIPYALLYAKEPSDGVWHCWLYVGTWQEGDTLTLGTLAANGYCVTMDYTTAAEDADAGGEGVFYFTFSCEGEPSFEFSVNGDTDGFVSQHADCSVAR